MIGFLTSEQPTKIITDKQQIDATYKYWRLHLMFSMYIGYGMFYFTRKSLNFAMPAMLADLGLEHSDIGFLGTLFYITYGVSKFVSGMVSDQSKPSYFMGLGLIATGIINIAFGLSSSLAMFAILWTLNAFFQGWGGPLVPNCSQHGIPVQSVAFGGQSGILATI